MSMFNLLTNFLKAIFVVFVLLVVIPSLASAQGSSDAIAVRVIPNLEYYSAIRWYRNQGFTGSPQSLTVDDYEAVRDGRTVYVNAANIVGTQLYTNIYVISYNQEAAASTIDIFGQLLKHWKFNINFSAEDTCSKTTDQDCLLDSNCPASEYCLSPKAQIIRDTRRMADMVDVVGALKNYHDTRNYYPKLETGSYLPNRTLSVWPSWQETLAQELATALPVDPINQLGDCPDYDPVTCWNENTKEFAGSIPDNPLAGSRVYLYWVESDGSSYGLCTLMESTYGIASSPFNCGGSFSANNPPVINNINLPAAQSGQSYAGLVTVSDPDGDTLTLTLDSSPGLPWTMWSGPPSLQDTADPNQKNIIAATAGAAGTYDLRLIVDDNKENGRAVGSYTITVTNNNMPIISAVSDQTIIVGNILDLTIIASDADNHYPLTFSVNGLPQGLSHSVINQHDCRIVGTVVDEARSYPITVTAVDYYQGHSSPVSFNITVQNNPPIITSTPDTPTAVGASYIYQIIATDPDGHNIDSYTAQGLPASLTINQANGLISGQPQTAGSYAITITVIDQYGAQAGQTYTLEIGGGGAFNINPLNDGNVYLCPPGICPPVSNVYYPVTYFNTVSITTADPVTYSLSGNPAFLVIHPSTGEMQGSPVDPADLGNHTITVIATTEDGISQSTSFILTVGSNGWCGDNVVQAQFGEECDGTNLNGQDCISLGFGGGLLLCSNCSFDTTGCCDRVDGGWSDWIDISPCSNPIGPGTKPQSRTCTNPAPSCNGADCVGPDNRIANCCTPYTCLDYDDLCGPISDQCEGTLFGGRYELNESDSTCRTVNPITGACTCPLGYTYYLSQPQIVPGAISYACLRCN